MEELAQIVVTKGPGGFRISAFNNRECVYSRQKLDKDEFEAILDNLTSKLVIIGNDLPGTSHG